MNRRMAIYSTTSCVKNRFVVNVLPNFRLFQLLLQMNLSDFSLDARSTLINDPKFPHVRSVRVRNTFGYRHTQFRACAKCTMPPHYVSVVCRVSCIYLHCRNIIIAHPHTRCERSAHIPNERTQSHSTALQAPIHHKQSQRI